jgi:ankyrin repeat protein
MCRGGTPLYAAIEKGDSDVVQALLDCGANPEADGSWGKTPLCAAVRKGDSDVVRALLDGGAKNELREGSEKALLWMAVAGRHFKVARLLVDYGADIEDQACDNYGEGSLQYDTIDTGSSSAVVQFFLDRGVNINGYGENGDTLLNIAIKTEILNDMIQPLIDGGANIEALSQSDYNYTPLCTAIRYLNLDISMLLLNAGACVEGTSNFGKTPLHHAASLGHPGATEFLLNHGAKVDSRTNEEHTPLHYAILLDRKPIMTKGVSQVQTIRILLEAGASIEAKDIKGRDILAVARKQNAPLEVINILLEQKKKNTPKSLFPRTVLHKVQQRSYCEPSRSRTREQKRSRR